MTPSTMARQSRNLDSGTARASRRGRMAQYMKAGGSMIRPMVLAGSYMLMETTILASGTMTRLKDLGSMSI